MKKITCIVLIQISLSVLYAIDYRQVLFGNNYERIEKVTDEESILENAYDVIVSAIKKKVDNYPCVLYKYPDFKYNELYKEVFGNGTIYRLLLADEEITADKILNMSFDYIGQVIFLKEKDDLYIIDYTFFRYNEDHDGMFASSKVDVYEGMEVINRNNQIKGVMKHKSEVEVRTHTNEDTGNHWIENKGFSNADYYEWKDLQNPQKYNLIKDNVYLFDGYNNRIEIESTRPLIDKKRPLMYTIQNAFDGNPATAYVEDTDDDSFSIDVTFNKAVTINKFLIINGYAQSNDLYFSNNRIKKIYFISYDINYKREKETVRNEFWKTYKDLIFPESMEPFVLNIPILEFNSFTLKTSDVFKGKRFNDTCIAEFDFNEIEIGWLFGE